MQIRVIHPARLRELLSYLRARGCIAYVDVENPDTIQALVPHLSGPHELEQIGALVARWQSENLDAHVEITPQAPRAGRPVRQEPS
jgi:hypothetical protein